MWMHMIETLQWEWNGKIPITMLVNILEYTINTFKYIAIHWKHITNTFKYIGAFWTASIYHQYTIKIHPYILIYIKVPSKTLHTFNKCKFILPYMLKLFYNLFILQLFVLSLYDFSMFVLVPRYSLKNVLTHAMTYSLEFNIGIFYTSYWSFKCLNS